MNGEEAGGRCISVVWLNDRERIASFHPVEGYAEQCFSNRDFFFRFLHDLQEQGYRFQ